MTKQIYRFLQAILLLALFFFLGFKVLSNQLSWYINPRFVTLVYIGILFLGILAYKLIMEIQRINQDSADSFRDHIPTPVNLLIMLLPLLVGILIPARPLGAAAISTKGLNSSSPLISSQSETRQLALASEQRSILDWVILFGSEDNLEPFMGTQASVIGFVYFDERLPAGKFYVSRIAISCCAADGFAVAMIADWHDAASLQEDTWVRVTGPVDMTYVADEPQATPLIHAEMVEIVPQPDQPYVYP